MRAPAAVQSAVFEQAIAELEGVAEEAVEVTLLVVLEVVGDEYEDVTSSLTHAPLTRE
jgi:hypothetical protein